MSAEDIWSPWEELEGPEAELRRTALEWRRELAREEDMAQAADIAQLLAQLTAANIPNNNEMLTRRSWQGPQRGLGKMVSELKCLGLKSVVGMTNPSYGDG